MRLKDKRIFIVEDNVENRIVYQMLFVREGALFDFERRGKDTLAGLKRFGPVDLIILDLMLPDDANGYDLFSLIRREEGYADVPIVAISSTDPSEAIPKARRLGFSGFIAKPIDIALFPQQLEQVLAGKKIWDEV